MFDTERAQRILEAAERALESIAPAVWDGDSLPVPIRRIAEAHFGLLVTDVPDIGAALGLAAPTGQISGVILIGQREIWIDAAESEQWPRRKRFTIAHECGHWALHRTAVDKNLCRAHEVRSFSPARPSLHLTLNSIEDEANLFGGALLMPPRLLASAYERLGGDEAALCDLFQVSPSAFDAGPGGRAHLHMRFALGRLNVTD